MTKRILNWRPSLPDQRDFSYHHIELMAPSAVLPPLIDLEPRCPPIFDQGQMGSCSGNSSGNAANFLQLEELLLAKPPGSAPQVFDPCKFDSVSRLFIYYGEREMEGSINQDAGATTLRDACKVLTKTGACRESLWPYKQNLLTQRPSSVAYTEAAKHKVPLYYALQQSAYELKRCLANGYPFMFGVVVYGSFMDEAAGATGIIPMPGMFESTEGGHAILCVGYDDHKQLFKFQNSWGTGWGDRGYGYLPYHYMLNPNLSDDHFTLRRRPTTAP